METLKLIWLIVVNLLASNMLGYLTTRGRAVLQFKPFNCRECLTFWVTLALGVIIAFSYSGQLLTMALIIAVLSAFLNYYYIKSKFKIYE